MDENDELVQEFLVESLEGLDRLDQEFVELEQDPGRRDLLSSVFRTIHTIKGTCGFLGFARLEKVTHVGENLLSRLREGEIELTPPRIEVLLHMVDAVRQMLAGIQAVGSDGQDDHGALIARLQALTDGSSAPPAEEDDDGPDPVTERLGHGADSARLEAPAPPPPPVAPPPPAPAAPAGGQAHATDQTVRVDVRLLERLMDLAGELVLARNQIQQYAASVGENGFSTVVQHLDLVTTEIQEGVMKTRMQPVGTAWTKLPRLVRDTASLCGKRVRLEMEGAETEVDRRLLEAIRDPLTHIVRNAIDHGIESAERRAAARKPREGTLRLRAWHEGGLVNIEVADDGCGLDLDRIRRKAVERGLITPEAATLMGEASTINLLFQPGFSTAEQVTSVSGRGVGMDVVRTSVAAVGGTVDLRSTPGRGTAVHIRLPLTLAILPTLLVWSGGQRFAIPEINVQQLLRFTPEQAAGAFERVDQATVYRLRGELVPVLRLHEELGIDTVPGSEDTELVVLQAAERVFGLAVDRVGDPVEIVVKPLSKLVEGCGPYAGATITGDGGVALILDVAQLAERAALGSRAAVGGDAGDGAPTVEPYRLLLVATPDDGRAAIVLDGVERLEEIPANHLESMGRQEVVQYRGQVMDVVRLSRALKERRTRPHRGQLGERPRDPLHVVVHHHEGGFAGIVVDEVIDIVEHTLEERMPARRLGVVFSVLIRERVTEIIDTDWIIRHAQTEEGVDG